MPLLRQFAALLLWFNIFKNNFVVYQPNERKTRFIRVLSVPSVLLITANCLLPTVKKTPTVKK
jgi:sugar lactone lactonase YvrE